MYHGMHDFLDFGCNGRREEERRVVDYLAEIISIYKNIINAKRKEKKRR